MSVPGNLFASVVTRPRPGEGPAQQLSFVAAVALARALDDWVAPARLGLKWPNDILLDGVKVAGILLEGGGGATIVGFGVNLAGHPGATERPATSFPAAGLAAPPTAGVAQTLSVRFAQGRAGWRDDGFDGVRAAWLDRAVGLGAPLEARLGHETIAGAFAGLAPDGALRVTLAGGDERLVHAGEVFAL